MTSEVLLALLQINVAVSAAILMVFVMRRTLRRQCGADLAYALWGLLPVTAMAAVLAALLSYPALPAFAWLAQMDIAPSERTLTKAWMIGGGALFALMALSHFWVLARARAGKVGPAVIGLIPRVYMPADAETRFTPGELVVLRAHERAHLIRNDTLANATMALAQCLFWFNPLIHIAAYLMRQDQEMACDAAVMAERPEQRRRYAATLLKAQLSRQLIVAGCGWFSHPLEERIATLARGDAGPRRRVVGAVVVVAAGAWLVLGYVTGYSTMSKPPSSQPPILMQIKPVQSFGPLHP